MKGEQYVHYKLEFPENLARLIDNEGELVIEMKVNIGSDKGVIVEVIPDIRYQQFKDRKKWQQAEDYCHHGDSGHEAGEEGCHGAADHLPSHHPLAPHHLHHRLL